MQVKVCLEDGFVYVPSLDAVLDQPVWGREVEFRATLEQFEQFVRPLLESKELSAPETSVVLEGLEVASAIGSTRLRHALHRIVRKQDTSYANLRAVMDEFGRVAGASQELVAAHVDSYASGDPQKLLAQETSGDVLHALLRSDHTSLSEDELATMVLWWGEGGNDLSDLMPHLRTRFVRKEERRQLYRLHGKAAAAVKPPPRLRAWRWRAFRRSKGRIVWETLRAVSFACDALHERHFEAVGTGEVALSIGPSEVACAAGSSGRFTVEVSDERATVVWWIDGKLIDVRSFDMEKGRFGLRAHCPEGRGAPLGCSYVGNWGQRCADSHADVPVDLYIW